MGESLNEIFICCYRKKKKKKQPLREKDILGEVVPEIDESFRTNYVNKLRKSITNVQPALDNL